MDMFDAAESLAAATPMSLLSGTTKSRESSSSDTDSEPTHLSETVVNSESKETSGRDTRSNTPIETTNNEEKAQKLPKKKSLTDYLQTSIVLSKRRDMVYYSMIDHSDPYYFLYWRKNHENNFTLFFLSQDIVPGESKAEHSYIGRMLRRAWKKPFSILQGSIGRSCNVSKNCSQNKLNKTCRFNSTYRKFTCQNTPKEDKRVTGQNVIELPNEFAVDRSATFQNVWHGFGKTVFLPVFDYFSILRRALFCLSDENATKKRQTVAKELIKRLCDKIVIMTSDGEYYKKINSKYADIASEYELMDSNDQIKKYFVEEPATIYFIEIYMKFYSNRFVHKNAGFLDYLIVPEKGSDHIRDFVFKYNAKEKNADKLISPLELTSVTEYFEKVENGERKKQFFSSSKRERKVDPFGHNLKTMLQEINSEKNSEHNFENDFGKLNKLIQNNASPKKQLAINVWMKQTREEASGDISFETFKSGITTDLEKARTLRAKQKMDRINNKVNALILLNTLNLIMGGRSNLKKSSKKEKTINRRTSKYQFSKKK